MVETVITTLSIAYQNDQSEDVCMGTDVLGASSALTQKGLVRWLLTG